MRLEDPLRSWFGAENRTARGASGGIGRTSSGQETFAAVDFAPSMGTLIFDIGGNKYRLIARRHAMPPGKSTPADRLRFLLESAAKKPSDLVPVFGQRSHVNEALNGRREISLHKARKLAKLFGVKPGVLL